MEEDVAKRQRKNYTPQEKVQILRRHLVDKVAVSDLCEEYHLHPTVFYRWHKEFFENGAAAFTHESSREQQAAERRIASLEEKLQKKNEVLSELMEEHVQLKKDLGEL
jgi:transposase